MSSADILTMLGEQQPEVLATIGAGNIDALVPEIKRLLTKTSTV